MFQIGFRFQYRKRGAKLYDLFRKAIQVAPGNQSVNLKTIRPATDHVERTLPDGAR
jgi:hypothetical protein